MSIFVPFSVNEQILKDIKRTYSSTKYFVDPKSQDGFNKLHRLLIAISSYKQIGYVQGMNFIAASFLWHCNEEFAYFLMTKLFSKMKMEDIYLENLQNVDKKCCDFFEFVLRRSSPEIYENLQSKEVLPVMLLPEWIITLGFSTVPIEKHVNLILGMFEHGWNYLYGVLLRFFRYLFPFFKDFEFAETLQIIKNNSDLKVKQEYGIDMRWEQLTKN